MCLKICELDSKIFFSAPRIACKSRLKKSKVKSDLVNNIDMLLMIEKGIRGEMSFVKKKRIIIFKKLNVNNLYRWAMPQKLAVNGFKWVEEKSPFSDGFIESYNEEINQ